MAFYPNYTPPPRVQVWTPQPAIAPPPPERLALSPNIVPQFFQDVNGNRSEIRGAAFQSRVDTYQRFLILDMDLRALGFEQQ